jgi:cholesterol oxidase
LIGPGGADRLPGVPASVSFSEELSGFIDFEEAEYEAAFRAGEAAGRRLALRLRVTADDADRFVADRQQAARVTGWVRGDAVGGPVAVEHGEFTLLDPDRRLDYRLHVHDGAGRPVTIAGFKLPMDGVPPPLNVRVLAGHVAACENAPTIATGMLHMPEGGLVAQIATFRVSPPLRLDSLARFGGLIIGEHWDPRR